MDRLAPLGVLALLLAAGCLSSSPVTRQQGPAGTAAAAGLPVFGAPITADARPGGSEPSVGIDGDGRIYYSYPTGLGTASRLTMSEDGGKTWKVLDPNPRAPLPIEAGAGGGDTSIAIAKDGSVYVTDLEAAAGSTVSSTHDHGKTWFTTPLGGPAPDQDREWDAVDSKGRVFLVSDNLASGIGTWVSRSDDGGQTFTPMGLAWDAQTMGSGTNGPMVISSKDVMEVPHQCESSQGICLSTSTDAGASWKTGLVAHRGVNTFNDITVAAIDKAGATYVVWSDAKDNELDVWMASSSDGVKWSAPVKVSRGAGTHLYPYIVAGDAGRVGIAWYETDVVGDNNDPAKFKDARWHVAYAQSQDALAGAPTFAVVNATDVMHKGTISTRGFNPGDNNPPDRGLGDFLTMAIDPEGHAAIAYVKGSQGADPFKSMLVRQVAGPALTEK